MILIGRYLSPFVRRSATLMQLAGLEYEQREVTTDQVDELSAFNPLARVPALDIGEEEAIVDSAAIVDYVLTNADPEHQLCPVSGPERRQTWRISTIAVGVMEKTLAAAYERSQRPKEKVHAPYRDKVLGQALAGLTALNDAAPDSGFFGGDAPNMADVNAVVAYDFLSIVAPDVAADAGPGIKALAERANALPAFANTRWGS